MQGAGCCGETEEEEEMGSGDKSENGEQRGGYISDLGVPATWTVEFAVSRTRDKGCRGAVGARNKGLSG